MSNSNTAEIQREEENISLSDREIQVMKLLAQGWHYKKVGQLLNITGTTVEVHRRNIGIKIRANGLPSFIRYAINNNILTIQEFLKG